MNPLCRCVLVLALGSALAIGCQAPTRILMIPVAEREGADFAALQAQWHCPLVVVRGVVYVPPAESLPLADESVRAALEAAAVAPPLVDDPRYLELPSHTVAGHRQFVVRGHGMRRLQTYTRDRLVDVRNRILGY